MSQSLRTLLQDILGVEPRRRPECSACQDLMHAYIEAVIEGSDAAAQFPVVAAHLAICPDCQEEIVDLKALFLAERIGALIEPPFDAIFNLSFLGRPGSSSTCRK